MAMTVLKFMERLGLTWLKAEWKKAG